MDADDYKTWTPGQLEDQEKQLALEAERLAAYEHNIRSNIEVVQRTLDWFESCVAAMGDVDSLDINETTNPEEVKFALVLGKKMKAVFQQKLAEYETEFSEYIEESNQVPNL